MWYNGSSNVEKSVKSVYYVGKIDIQIYRCVTSDITTDELIITEKQIEHIFENHPNDFSDIAEVISCIQEAVFYPDYIIESDKPYTAFILKELSDAKGKSRLIMRIKTGFDSEHYKNSIITFQKMREKEWKRLIKNKKILYKNE